MARKKEPERVELNRNKIAEVAKQMFLTQGINNVNMNEIAKKVNMSKSTLYVYFQNKEQIYNYITLGAMQQFYEQISNTLAGEQHNLHAGYIEMCHALVEFKKANPISFEMIVKNICVEDSVLSSNKELMQIYEIGEKVNSLILNALTKGVSSKNDQTTLNVQSIFTLWGAIYGLITLADNKEEYIQKSMGISKDEFLKNGFEQLFAICSK